MSDNLRQKAEARYAEAREKVTEAVNSGRAAADEALKNARARADEAYASARTKASEAATSARINAKRAASKTSEGIKTNPIAAVAGGLAIGAIVAALVPRTKREDETLGKTGKKLRDTAGKAAKAARDAGQSKLDSLGVNSEAARGQVKELLKKVGEAAGTAGTAAADTVRKAGPRKK